MPGAYEQVACDDTWQRNGYTTCDGACMNSSTALFASGPGCSGATTSGPVTCQKTFEYDGLVGCCITESPNVLFGECNP